jgi:hypothetical protein
MLKRANPIQIRPVQVIPDPTGPTTVQVFPLKLECFGGTYGTTLLKKSEGPKIIFSCVGTVHRCADFFLL